MARKAMSEGFPPIDCNRTIAEHAEETHLVAVVAFDGVVNGDLSTACELFSRARSSDGRPLYQLRVCASSPLVETEHLGLSIPWRLASVRRASTVIVPGLDDIDRAVVPSTLAAIGSAARRGARVASICTGAFVLARTGLLDGRRATTHWLAAAELERRYPQVRVDPSVLYVDSGPIITSAGAAAAFDMCLHMIRTDHGAQVAARVAREAVMPLERAGGQAQFIVHAPPDPGGLALGALTEWLNEHLEQPWTLARIARRAKASTRTLSRHFKEHTGLTPSAWVSRARVLRAQELLETTQLSVEQVARAVGFTSAAILRERFRRLVGSSPSEHRRAFRQESGAPATPSARAG